MYVGASLCLWLVRGWKVGEVERAQRRDAIVHATPLTRTLGEMEKNGSPVDNPRDSDPAETDAQLWAPVGLIRRMVAMKRV
jgi:hypothetical protein